MSKNGATVAAFERELAAYCGARHAIAASNGTVTLQAALVALGVTAGDKVAVPPLTMAATTIAVLNVCAAPVFVDVTPDTWLAENYPIRKADVGIGVSLYGLHWPAAYALDIDDAAQTLRPHNKAAAFTSLSFQASKILSTGEGGALLTDSDELAAKARSYLSLGYKMTAGEARIDPTTLKSPTFDRHHSLGINGRMNDLTAAEGLRHLAVADTLKLERQLCAQLYANEGAGCAWLTPQHVPEGWTHDYWTFAVACDTPQRALLLSDAVVKHGGERPYPAWMLTYREIAFRHLAPFQHSDPRGGPCPVAESLQPRLLQMQTNDLASAERTATALRLAIQEIGC